jgi:hypothetical protein
VKRLFLPAVTVLTVVLLTAIPAFGQAYGGRPGLDCDDEVVTGQRFEANSTVTIEVNGTPVGTANTDSTGSFTFPLPDSLAAGSYDITVQGVTVSVVCRVGEVGGDIVTPPGAGDGGDVGGGGIAFTGSNVAMLGLVAAVLLGAGVLLLTAGRRRRRAAVEVGGDDRPI